MTDLNFLSDLKSKSYITNSYVNQNDIFDRMQKCLFELQKEEGLFCFYKNTNYQFKQLFFYFTNDFFLGDKVINFKNYSLVAEMVFLKKNVTQRIQISNCLNRCGFFHYRTFLRMFLINISTYENVDFSQIAKPVESDYELIKTLLESSFDIYSERIPTADELRLLEEGVFIIKENNQIAAVLISEVKGKTSELRYWLVATEYRHRGFGGILMKYYLTKNKEINRYTLWVDSSNQNAIDKYKYFGFNEDKIMNTIYINMNIMKDKIKEILVDTRPEFDFADSAVNFMEAGYLDSFDIITIVADLESAFDVKILGSLIVPESFVSIESIVKLVQDCKDAS